MNAKFSNEVHVLQKTVVALAILEYFPALN